ncbi:MAG: bifunctional riboflavin kinase/FAD synthetase [Candidatus Omnitrophota bacterium]
MKVLRGYKGAGKSLIEPVLAIGVFDGVHLGHRKVIEKMMSSSGGGDKTILTFDPHPETVLRPHLDLPRIMSLEHRLKLFREMGLDAAIIVKFSRHIAEMSPEDFIERVIRRGIGSERVFVGDNFYFGKGACAGTARFRKAGTERCIKVDVVKAVKKGGKVISSTRLRKLVSAGSLDEAEKLLGRPFSVLGTVVSGDGIGRVIGTPTANIDPHHEVIPPVGVYAVKIALEGKHFPGVLNIGYKPTFYGRSPKRKEPVIEAHILGFSGDLYGMDIEVFFVKRLRSEQHFSSKEKLRSAIEKDIETARAIMTVREQG